MYKIFPTSAVFSWPELIAQAAHNIWSQEGLRVSCLGDYEKKQVTVHCDTLYEVEPGRYENRNFTIPYADLPDKDFLEMIATLPSVIETMREKYSLARRHLVRLGEVIPVAAE